MKLERLEDGPGDSALSADVVIVGGGACGLTLARALSGRMRNIVVLESGEIEESDAHAELNRVVVPGCEAGADDGMQAFRARYHSVLARKWSAEVQPYGVRCRGLGGSTIAWAGKSAPFEVIDYEARDWVPLSGWPVTAAELDPHLRRAEAVLGLGPAEYGPDFWQIIGRDPPEPRLPAEDWASVFWQFSRSSLSATGIRRFGPEFLHDAPAGVKVVVGATVTEILADPDGGGVASVSATSLSGKRLSVSAPVCVLAASAVENARLLLASGYREAGGLGNRHDQVGRHLTDHIGAVLGRYGPDNAGAMATRFGFFGYRHDGRSQIAMHGLALSEQAQRDGRLLNGAVYLAEERAPDDPFSALGRLLRRRSASPMRDLSFVAQSPGRLLRGLGVKVLESGKLPDRVTRGLADTAVRYFPNSVASDVRYGKMPHKFMGARVEGICEQAPDPENRVTLSAQRDALGARLPEIRWRVGQAERHTLLQMAGRFRAAMQQAGLAVPEPADWVAAGQGDAARLTDMGHSMGTTRMAADPRHGVVDTQCQVHGVPGLYIAGGSVMPTGGHANPTLMMLALTLRLADHLIDGRLHRAAAGRGSGSGPSGAAGDSSAP